MQMAEEARRGLGGYGARREKRVAWTQGQFNTGFGTMTGSEIAKAAAGALGVLAGFYALVFLAVGFGW